MMTNESLSSGSPQLHTVLNGGQKDGVGVSRFGEPSSVCPNSLRQFVGIFQIVHLHILIIFLTVVHCLAGRRCCVILHKVFSRELLPFVHGNLRTRNACIPSLIHRRPQAFSSTFDQVNTIVILYILTCTKHSLLASHIVPTEWINDQS